MDRVDILNWRLTSNGDCFVSCPGCGLRASLDHVVEENGDVTPSLDCSKCDFHAHVSLVGWNQGRIDFHDT